MGAVVSGFLIVFAFVMGISTGAGDRSKIASLKSEAIEHGYAQYDAKTGEWGWK